MTIPRSIRTFDQTWFCNEQGYDITRIKPYAAYDVGADSWVVKPPHLPHWSLSELPKAVQQVLRAADSYARHVLKLPEPERTQQGAALFEAWHTDRSRAFSERGEGWWDIANLREKFGDQAGWWAQLVDCAHRAKQGLDAAPADWSNIPTGYVTAASRSETGAYPSRVSHHELERLVPGYDPEEHAFSDPSLRRATFSYVHRFPVRSLPEAEPTSPEFYAHSVDHDSERERRDHLEEMRELGDAIKQNPHSVPPIVVDHTRGFPLLDGSHRSGLALHHGVEHLPAYVRDGGRERTTATIGHRVTAKLPKTQKCDYCTQQATKRVIWAEGMAYIPVCDEHEQRAIDHVGDDYCNTRPIAKTAGAGSPDHHPECPVLRRMAVKPDSHHDEVRWFHGTNADLNPEAAVEPRQRVGTVPSWPGNNDRADRVWITDSVADAHAYAQQAVRQRGGKPAIYEVEPGNHRPFAKFDHWRGPVEQRVTDRATVLRKIPVHELEAELTRTSAVQLWITPQLVMGSAAGLNHARQVNSASEAVAAVQQGLTAVLPPGSWFQVRQVLLGLGMSLLDVTQRLKQFGAPSSVTG